MVELKASTEEDLVKEKEQNRFFNVFLTVHHTIDLFQVTNLMHTSFIL